MYAVIDDLCRLVVVCCAYCLHVRLVDIFVTYLIFNLYDSVYDIIFVNTVVVRCCYLVLRICSQLTLILELVLTLNST